MDRNHTLRFLASTIVLALMASAIFTMHAAADDSPPPAGSTPAPSTDTTSTSSADTSGSTSTTSSDGSAVTSSDSGGSTSTTSSDTTTTTSSDTSSSPTADAGTSSTDTTIATPVSETGDTGSTDVSATPVPESSTTATADSGSTADSSTAPSDVTATPTAEAGATPSPDASTGDTTASTDLTQLPADTTVVALDSSGQSVPLGTQQAADIVGTGDPIWCPTGVAPIANVGGCTDTRSTLYGLIHDIVGPTLTPIPQPAANGVIWILQGTDTSGSWVDINGGTLTTWANFSLTLKGGWTGTSTGTIQVLNPSSFSVPISIQGWKNNITLSDIVIGSAGSGASSSALYVETTKNISLTRINVHNSTGSTKGAYLTNNALGATGTVTISSSQFDNNTGGADGLLVYSNGLISLSNVEAVGNSLGTGAFLDNHTSTTHQPVTLSGPNTFGGSYYNNLTIWSKGAVTANDITSTGSTHGWGVSIDNCQNTGTCQGVGAVTLTGTNIFAQNGTATTSGGGLFIMSNGAIKLNNVIANDNGYFDGGSGYYGRGANLDNSLATLAQPVTLTGSSQFKYNKMSGLVISSRGLVTLNNISANGSVRSDGADIDNCLFDFVTLHACVGSGNVVLTGSNFFQDNYYDGLYLHSGGSLSFNNVNASWNGQSGAELDNCLWYSGACKVVSKPVTLTGANVFSSNGSTGLSLVSGGGITAYNLTANDNASGQGASLYNAYPGSVGGVTLFGASFFIDNQMGDGLHVESLGAISISNVTATGNGMSSSGSGVSLTNFSGLSKPITLNGTNELNGNKDLGLTVSSSGPITVNNLTASDNLGGGGAYLYTTYNSSSVPSVGLTGTNTFEQNSGRGLELLVSGVVVLNNLNASQNGLDGVDIDNTPSGALTPRNISLTGFNTFNENHNTGLDITSYGAVSLSYVTALKNGLVASNGYGVDVYAAGGSIPKGFILSGTNLLNGNYSGGLYAQTLGPIMANNLTASDTVNDRGVGLYNAGSGVGGVTLGGTNTFERNHTDGLYVSSNGAIAASNLHADDNGSAAFQYGVSLNNAGAPTGTPGVKVTGTNVFNHNYYSGLNVNSLGAISASNLTANNSRFGYGVEIYNDYGSSTAGATLIGVNVFNENWYSGLEIGSFGTISLMTTSITANQNGKSGSYGYGVHLDNCQYSSGCTGFGNVTISGLNKFNDNYLTGLEVFSAGAISTSNLTANGNTNGGGAHLNNSPGSGGAVTMSGVNQFNVNYGAGLSVDSAGAMSANSVTALGNGTSGFGQGVVLENTNPFSGTPGVMLTGTNFLYANQDTNLTVNSLGAISLNNITASNSVNGDGVDVDNCQMSSTCQGVGAVTLSGANAINDNRWMGLYVRSFGAITINNLTADHNQGGSGAFLINDYTGGTAGVILTGVNQFDDNADYGLYIDSIGAVSLTKITADNNGSAGSYAGIQVNTAGKITLMCGSFIDNHGYGYYLYTSAGSIALTGVVSFGNTGSDFASPTPTIVRNCPIP